MIEIKLKKESSPIGFDLALTSIDNKGNLGRLNEFVISQKGLPIDLIPNPKILEFGYSQAVVPETKERIGFVVTIGHDKTFDLLKRNFSKAVSSLNEQHKIRSIWIPLMGTGAGGRDYRRSFEAIIPGLEILKNIKRNFQLEISLPSDIDLDTEHWISNKIEFIINNREKETAKEQSPEFITNRSFYAVGHFFDGTENQLPRFINDSIWENGYEEKQTNTVNKVEQGDILILKSTNTKGLFVKAIGIVIDNAENGHLLYVNWVQIEEVFLEGLNAYQYTIRRIVENVDRLLNGLNEKVENLPEIIDKLTSFKPTSINWKYFSKKYQSIQESFELIIYLTIFLSF